jgi:signal transduction histidine kinase
MWRAQFRDYLLPARAEKDEGFRHEIERLGVIGLQVVGGVQIGVSLFMLAIRFLVSPESAALYLRLRQGAAIIVLGIVNMLAGRIPFLARWSRQIGFVSAVLTTGILIWASMVMSSQSTNPNDFIPGQITMVMLVAVTTVPLRPMHTFSLGIAIGITYVALAKIAEQQLMEGLGPDDNYILFILMLTLLCTAITALLYAQRLSNYRILHQTIEASEALRDAQTRIVMAESASSLSRLAAAVSHEMNNPIGALLSGVDTLLLLAAKQATADGKENARLVQLQADVRKSVQESAQRLKELVKRVQRFTNLDQAEVQAADLNDMLKDVTALVSPDLKKTAHFELDLQPLPALVCRPQQLSVVFSNIVNNAVTAVNGNGKVVISTRQNGSEIQIDVEDNGRGMSSRDMHTIFDPGFRVAEGRVATGNWSMFSSRQIVREHGGEIRIASAEGQGTRVTVTLPVSYIELS